MRLMLLACSYETEKVITSLEVIPLAFDTKPWFGVVAGEGQAPPACDTKPWFCVAAREGQVPHAQDEIVRYRTYKTHITQNLCFVWQARRNLPHHVCDAKNHSFASQPGGRKCSGPRKCFRNRRYPRSCRFGESA